MVVVVVVVAGQLTSSEPSPPSIVKKDSDFQIPALNPNYCGKKGGAYNHYPHHTSMTCEYISHFYIQIEIERHKRLGLLLVNKISTKINYS